MQLHTVHQAYTMKKTLCDEVQIHGSVVVVVVLAEHGSVVAVVVLTEQFLFQLRAFTF